MSSLLTNNSAMVALQTLKTINKNMSEVQNQISTGKRIANARDNAALWGISTTMQTDVTGFKAISESLSLGSATLSVGRDAAETITSLLDQMKGKIVAAQEENVDRNKIQADITALRNQIGTVTNAAQFNGLNLLQGEGDVRLLASMNRSVDPDGTQRVTDEAITFARQDLTMNAARLVTSSGAVEGATPLAQTAVLAQTQTATVAGTLDTGAVADVTGVAVAADLEAQSRTMTATSATNTAGTAVFTITVGGEDVALDIVLGEDAGVNGIASAIRTAITDAQTEGDPTYDARLANLVVTGAADEIIVRGDGFTEFALAFDAGGATGATVTGGGTEAVTSIVALEFDGATITAGQEYTITLGGTDFAYTAEAGDDAVAVADALAALINDPSNTNGVAARVETVGDVTSVVVANSTGDPAGVSLTSESVSNFVGTSGAGDVTYSITLGADDPIDITVTVADRTSVDDVTTALRTAIADEIASNTALAGFSVSGEGAEIVLTGSGYTAFTTAFSDVAAATGTSATGTGAAAATAVDALSLAADMEIVAGQGYQITVAGLDDPLIYRAVEGDTVATVAAGLAALVNEEGADIGVTAQVDAPAVAGDPTLVRLAYTGDATAGVQVSSATANESFGPGGLFGLRSIDVTTADGPAEALQAIEGFIQSAITAAASFGSAQGRVQTQSDFVSKLMDGFTSGIGVLVDADMEAASARLQALQVQQQLGIQALSIANQAPQNILALFR